MRLHVLLLAPVLAASACGGDDDDPAFLGPVDGGAVQDAKQPDVAPPPVSVLASAACAGSAPVDTPAGTIAVRSIATLESRGLLALHGEVRAVQIGGDGCPGAAIPSFGNAGSLSIDATSAVALPGGRSLVASGSGTLLLDSTGAQIDSCKADGEDMVTRALHATADGRVAAAFTKSPIALLDLGLAANQCTSVPLSLSPAPYALTAVAFALPGGFVTVEQASPASPLVVARYGTDGVRIASSSAFASQTASKLCSATGLIDTPAGVFVTDTTCRRAVLFEGETLHATHEITFDPAPRGAALSPDQRHVLVALAQSVNDRTTATFERVELP
jgi:hypothetical protein